MTSKMRKLESKIELLTKNQVVAKEKLDQAIQAVDNSTVEKVG